MNASKNCYDLIKHFEDLRLKAYKDTAGIWTIGWGHTSDNFLTVKPDSVITEDTACELLKHDVHEAELTLKKQYPLHAELNQNQFDALTSFVFNRGTLLIKGTGAKSTLLKHLEAEDFSSAADEFYKWVYDEKKNKLPGLIARREAERALFISTIQDPDLALTILRQMGRIK